jgi:general secretion pathway protein E
VQIIYRLDPDVILVSEVRDGETARKITQAALSGSLVLSSVHASTATGTLFRLTDLGVEPFLVSSAVTGVVNQRLVRRVCPHCSALREAPEDEQLAYEREMGERRTEFYYGTGCKLCAHTGYLGRTGVFELLVLSGEVKRMLIEGASGKEIKDQAVEQGMTTLQHAGMQKVKEGITTPREVMRNVYY